MIEKNDKKFRVTKFESLTNTKPLEEPELSLREFHERFARDNFYSHILFDGSRKSENFKGVESLCVDIDDDLTIAGAVEALRGLGCSYSITPTKSHNIEKNGKVVPRFRILIPLAMPTSSPDEYKRIIVNFTSAHFDSADSQTHDCARLWIPSTGALSDEEKTLDLIETDKPFFKISDFYLRKAEEKIISHDRSDASDYHRCNQEFDEVIGTTAAEGSFNHRIFNKSHELARKGLSEKEVFNYIEKAISPKVLDLTDAKTIRSGCKNGQEAYPLPLGPVEWINDQLESVLKIDVSPVGAISHNRKSISFEEVQDKLYVVKTSKNIKRIDKQLIRSCVNLYILDKKGEALSKIINRISLKNNDGDKIVRNFLSALTGEVKEFQAAAFSHFLANIKRKMLNKESYHELMPILYGPQGCGKSYAIKKLIEPIREVAFYGDFIDLTDKKGIYKYKNYYAYVLDEMTYASRSDINSVKNLITSKDVGTREMYRQENLQVENNLTLIGASNNPASECLYDQTGMRRFFEIAIDDIDHEAINNMDYLELWTSINEDHDYFTPYIDEIREHQDLSRARCSVEQWADEKGFLLEEGCSTIWIENKYLYPNYVEESKRNQEKPLGKQNWGKRMKKLGFLDSRKSRKRGWNICNHRNLHKSDFLKANNLNRANRHLAYQSGHI